MCIRDSARKTDNAENLAAIDIKVDTVQRNYRSGSAAKGLVQTLNPDDHILCHIHSSLHFQKKSGKQVSAFRPFSVSAA